MSMTIKDGLSQKYSIGTNIAGITTATLNLELSASFNRNLSIHLPLSWNPFTLKGNRKLLHLGLQPGVRWWFWHVYSGFFGAAQLNLIRYNCGLSKYRFDGKGYGVSISAGYSKMVSRRWNLDFEAGVAIGRLIHDCYERVRCGEYLFSEDKIRVLPGRVSIAVVYLL